LHEDKDLSAQYPEKVKEMKLLMDRARTESKLFNFGKAEGTTIR